MLDKRRWDEPLQTYVDICMGVELPWRTAVKDRDHYRLMEPSFVARVLCEEPKLSLPRSQWLMDT